MKCLGVDILEIIIMKDLNVLLRICLLKLTGVAWLINCKYKYPSCCRKWNRFALTSYTCEFKCIHSQPHWFICSCNYLVNERYLHIKEHCTKWSHQPVRRPNFVSLIKGMGFPTKIFLSQLVKNIKVRMTRHENWNCEDLENDNAHLSFTCASAELIVFDSFE